MPEDSTEVRSLGGVASETPNPVPQAWLAVWTYLGLPILVVLTSAAAVLPAQGTVVNLLFSPLTLVPPTLVAIAIGLHRRRLWAWKLNWFAIFLVFLLLLMPQVLRASADAATMHGALVAGTVMFGLAWLWPNYRYFSRRRPLFVGPPHGDPQPNRSSPQLPASTVRVAGACALSVAVGGAVFFALAASVGASNGTSLLGATTASAGGLVALMRKRDSGSLESLVFFVVAGAYLLGHFLLYWKLRHESTPSFLDVVALFVDVHLDRIVGIGNVLNVLIFGALGHYVVRWFRRPK